jgi:cytochrome c-type biogenesis protein CcmE
MARTEHPPRHNGAVDPARKRKLRFVIALSCALLLASALIYTSFSASSEARTPSQLAAGAKPGRVYQLTGKVQPGSISGSGTTHTFRVRDREGNVSVPVSYTGSLPDPFRDGREIIVDVRKQGGTFVGQPDTLVTKCPSKFSAEKKT